MFSASRLQASELGSVIGQDPPTIRTTIRRSYWTILPTVQAPEPGPSIHMDLSLARVQVHWTADMDSGQVYPVHRYTLCLVQFLPLPSYPSAIFLPADGEQGLSRDKLNLIISIP